MIGRIWSIREFLTSHLSCTRRILYINLRKDSTSSDVSRTGRSYFSGCSFMCEIWNGWESLKFLKKFEWTKGPQVITSFYRGVLMKLWVHSFERGSTKLPNFMQASTKASKRSNTNRIFSLETIESVRKTFLSPLQINAYTQCWLVGYEMGMWINWWGWARMKRFAQALT